jgi:hypothetical protein
MHYGYSTVILLAFIGLMVGLVLFVSQSPTFEAMNPLGLVAFSSLGASVGCLIADRAENRR